MSKTIRLLVAMALAAAALAALAACGGGESDEDKVREVAELATESDPEVCDNVTDDFLDKFYDGSRSDCEKDAEDDEGAEGVDIEKVEIDGDEATVEADVDGSPGSLQLVKDGDDWRIDDIEAAEAASEETDTEPQAE